MQETQVKYFPLLFIVLVSGLLIAGCARSFNPDINRGSTYQYQPGHPEVRLSTIGLLDEENNPLLEVTADIVYGSLIYKSQDEEFTAQIRVEIQVRDVDSDQIIESEHFPHEIRQKDKSVISRQDVLTLERTLTVKPGNYEVYFTVIDQNSGNQTTRRSRSFIPDPSNNITALTSVRMLAKDLEGSADWSPVTTYDVPGKIDSLKFIFQVTNNKDSEPLTINTKLSRYLADTTAARPMHYPNLSQAHLRNKGIDYNEEEVIQTNQRTLIEEGSILIEYTFPRQQRGNYRFEVTADTKSDDRLFKARDFGIKSTNYPSIQTAREMAQPMIYLMNEREYNQMMAITDDDSLKNAIDRFWLKNIGNKNETRQVIRMYYERVEEANKQFSNFKEGWKTDPGMMYILFGPPWYVTRSLDRMLWSYSYNRQDPEYNFYFIRSDMPSEFYPFHNYTLQRSQHYFTIQYQQLQLWLNGGILRRAL